MHQTLEIFMARKKRVPGYYNPDSNRIFDDQVTDQSLGDSKINKEYVERKIAPPPPHPREPERRHCPQPYYSRFLTNNARTLNEPICVIQDDRVDSSHWWQTTTAKEEISPPPVTIDTTQRNDYVHHGELQPSPRHMKNFLQNTTTGIVPVNPVKRKEDAGEVLLEKISFFHDYNSRQDPLMPKKGKLRGFYVWDRVVKDTDGKDIVETPWNKGHLERQRSANSAKNATSDESKQEKKCDDSQKNTNSNTNSPPSNPNTIPPIDGIPAP